MKKISYLILLMILMASPLLARTNTDLAGLFLKANEAYQQGDYPSAESLYRNILDAGIRNGKIYYNLGNALFRQGKTGEAIQNYLLAQQFIPRNEDLEANLGYARQKAEDRVEPSAGVVRNILFWYDRLTLKEMTLLFLACNVLFWSGLIARLFFHSQAVTWLALLFFAVGITMAGTAAIRLLNEQNGPSAVIILREVPVRSGMDPESTTLFVLHDGAEVKVENRSGDWSLIRFASGKKGWVRNEQIGIAVL